MNKKLAIMTLLFFCIPVTGAVQAATKYYTAVTNSNVRVGPTINSHKITYLKSGKRVRVIGSAAGGKWHQVQLDSGQMGYVYARLLVASDSGPPPGKPLIGGQSPCGTGHLRPHFGVVFTSRLFQNGLKQAVSNPRRSVWKFAQTVSQPDRGSFVSETDIVTNKTHGPVASHGVRVLQGDECCFVVETECLRQRPQRVQRFQTFAFFNKLFQIAR